MTNSYNASCYVESNDGQYHMECEMSYDGKEIYSDYDGNNFIDGLNAIMDDMTAQMFKSEESLEDKVVRLEDLIAKLQAENNYLNEYIKNLKNDKDNENCKDCEDDASCKCQENNQSSKIDEAIEQFNNFIDEIANEKNYKYKTTDLDIAHWPYKLQLVTFKE